MDKAIKDNLLKHFGLFKKSKYYDITNLLLEGDKNDFKYFFPIGARTAGKSYQCKEVVLWEAYHSASYSVYKETGKIEHKDRYQFAYIRRWNDDITLNRVLKYFNSHTIAKDGKKKNRIEEITNGEYNTIEAWQGAIYFSHRDPITMKVERGKEIGHIFAINIAQKYKSLEYPLIENIIFEEFLPDDKRYCPDEVTLFNSIVSTIERGRPCRKFLIGNTNVTFSPYFTAWGMKKVVGQPPNSIEKYIIDTGDSDMISGKPIIIRLIVEVTDEAGVADYSTIGDMRKSVSHGIWNIKVYPHLKYQYEKYDVYYQLLIDDSGSRFSMELLRYENDEPFLYVKPYPVDKNDIQRVITDKFSTSPFVTVSLDKVTKYDELVRKLVQNKKIAFCSDVVGEEFYNLIKVRGGL